MRAVPRFLVASLFLLLAAQPASPRNESGKLGDDGRAGEVVGVQGTALVRPPDRLRWTPLARRDLLLPGDILRTAPRGAHALDVRMGTSSLLLGPGTTIEVKGPGALHLRQGVLEVKTDETHPITVTGAGDYAQEVKGTLWAESDARATKALPDMPRWLKAYRASTSDEWMGALVANVDGRDVSLAVGSHHVVAEIRDQIARTTIEQAFVNTTSSTLEGVFYFPLPAGASISGFGMWIGDELVEADVVERQRARQIYEDILRRKKDPGLLEWEGGNLFKARVFPILPNSNKRIRIRYTQVLPLEGRTFRYSHALRSELLRSKPLRELQLTVRVDASAGIEQVSSPTHDVQISKTDTTAEVRFSAQEFTPERDFEVAVRVKPVAPVALLPHRRGEDGYFLVQLSPPGSEANGWQRELVPEGDPLDIVVVADTSGSMDEAARRNQDRFLSALAHILGEKDRVRLLAHDVEPIWIVKTPVAADSDGWANGLAALRARRSLGWSDIDRAFAEVATATTAGSLVLYLGDGVGTTGDADPQALADRLTTAHKGMTVHAVAPSSSYEAPVLQALAALGGGSLREVGAHPAQTAARLLGEALRPMVRDLQVEVKGLRTARVYPEKLPNLPVGMQQSVLGRYKPEAGTPEVAVTVRGTLSGRPVTYNTKVVMPAADGGNSFLPRLWARKHLNMLLAQGRSSELNAEIVEFSERFGIMTPLTSFLVLESDEDRERYGVERRVRMRDGERFFAEARDKVALEARRDAVRRASGWRTRQRHDILREIARLGRDLPIPFPSPVARHALGVTQTAAGYGAFGGELDGLAVPSPSMRMARNMAPESKGRKLGEATYEQYDKSEDGGDWGAASSPAPSAPVAGAMPMRGRGGGGGRAGGDHNEDADDFAPAESVEMFDAEEEVREGLGRSLEMRSASKRVRGGYYQSRPSNGRLSLRGRRTGWPTPPISWGLEHLGFPTLPPAFELPERSRAEDPWPEEERALLKRLVRRGDVAAGETGLHVRVITKHLQAPRHTVRGASLLEAWIGSKAWRMRHRGTGGSEPSQAWVAGGHRGAMHAARRLARRRAAEKLDHEAWSLPFWDLHPTSALDQWEDQGYTPKITARADGRVEVTLRRADATLTYFVLVVDTTRNVVLETRWLRNDGKVMSTMRRDAFVEVGGRYYPGTVETLNDKGKRLALLEATWKPLDAAGLTAALAPVTTLPGDVLLVEGKLPKEVDAKQAHHDGRATFVDHLARVLALAGRQQWDDVFVAWEAARKFAPVQTPGLQWMHLALVAPARRGETLRAFSTTLVPLVMQRKGLEAVFLARLLSGTTARQLGAHERIDLHDALAAAWKHPDETYDPALARARTFDWMRTRAQLLDQARRHSEAYALRARLAKLNPHHLGDQLAHETDLWAQGEFEQALGHVRKLLADGEPWTEGERNGLYRRLLDRLWQRRDLAAAREAAVAWTQASPEVQDAYVRAVSLLFFLDKTKEADGWIASELDKPFDAALSKTGQARLGAAIHLGLGDGWNFSVRTLTPELSGRLHDAALHASRVKGAQRSWARQITRRVRNDWRFRRSDDMRRLTESMRADLLADDAIELMDLERLHLYVHDLPWRRNQAETATWRAVVDRVRARWTDTDDDATAHRLADFVVHLLDTHEERDEAITFVRARIAREVPSARQAVREDLLRRLHALKAGTQAVEDEMASLIADILADDKHVQHKRARAAEFARAISARFFHWRYEAALGPQKAREAWTRAERKQRNKEARLQARRELVTRLETLHGGAPAAWKPWLTLERIGYALEIGDDVPTWVASATAILDHEWKRDGNPLDRWQRERAAIAMVYGAARSNATPELRERVLARLRRGVDAAPTDADAKPLLDWKHELWRALMALDRADELAGTLRTWIVPSKVESRWRIHLGYLEAELGRLPEAIEQFRAAKSVDELDAEHLRFVATLHLVRGDDEAREAALDAALAREPDWRLNSQVYTAARRLARRGAGVKEELDPETLRAARVLIRKTSRPGQYAYQIVRLYRATKDHRVLDALAGGVTGHTKEGLYGLLRQLENVTKQIHEEATADALMARLTALLPRTESTVDRRGLHLAMARIASRAAQVKERDPAHAARALAALRAARKGAFVKGEARLVAEYFATLGRIPDRAFAAELRSQAEAIFAATPKGSADRGPIGLAVAKIAWTYGDQEEALASLHRLIVELRAEHDGVLVRAHRNVLRTHVDWLVKVKRFRVAEQQLLTELSGWKQEERRRQLRNMLYRTTMSALLEGGAMSRGRGRALFDALTSDLEREIERHPRHVRGTIDLYCDLVQAVHHKRALPGVVPFFDTFVRERLPAVLQRMPLQAWRITARVGDALRALQGARRALAFLLDAQDLHPTFVVRMEQDIWRRRIGTFAKYRYEARTIGDLEPRLLALVLGQLERNLRAGGAWYGNAFWQRTSTHFWGAHEQKYADTAQRMAELHAEQPRVVVASAKLLYSSLKRHAEGIDVLRAAYDRGTLESSHRAELASWYEERKRYAEGIPIAKQLVAEEQDALPHRLRLARLYLGVGNKPEALATLQATETRWREAKHWSAHAASQIGKVAAQHGLPQPAATWLEEALRMRREARGNRGGADRTAATWYGWLAEARVALREFDGALHAATASLAASRRHRKNELDSALDLIRRVIDRAPDLDAFTKAYEAGVDQTGVDATPIRLAFASAFEKRKDYDGAIRHLLAARELDGGDAQVHTALVRAYDLAGRPAEAIEALFGSIRLAPHALGAYEDLARRYAAVGDAAQAERARTTLVEPAPHQAEGHGRLARLRQAAGQWKAAIEQWEQVVRTEPLDPNGWVWLGDARAKDNDKAGARAAYQHVLGTEWEDRFDAVKQTAASRLAALK